MAWVFQIIISTLTIIFAISVIIQLVLNGKKTDIKTKYIWFVLSAFVLSSGEMMLTLYWVNYYWIEDHGLVNLRYYILFYKYMAISCTSPLWLIFCLSFSYRTLTPLEKKLYKYKWTFFIPGLIFLLMLIKTEEHGLVYYVLSEGNKWLVYLGLASKIHSLKDFSYFLWGLIIVLRYIYNRYPYFKKQAFIIIIGVFIPSTTANIYYETSLYQQTNNFDISPLMYLITLILFNFAILKYRFLNITPVAFSKMADELKESILIVDADRVITYHNKAFLENFSGTFSIDSDVTQFTDFIKKNVVMTEEIQSMIHSIERGSRDKFIGEIKFSEMGKGFAVNIQPLFNKRDFIGQIITFYDITEYKRLLLEVEKKNTELCLANIQLKEHAAAVEELAVARERNRFAGDVHDSVGHTMTVLISLIGVCTLASEKDMGMVKEKLDEMMKIALKGHDELRRSVRGIIPGNEEVSGMVQEIQLLIKDFEKTGVKVDLSVNGQENTAASMNSSTVYRICQEALTNSLRHGQATQVNILLRFTEELLSLYIFDDGIGCREIKKNVGLTYMEKRVKDACGKITYGSDGEKGFNILVEIPLS